MEKQCLDCGEPIKGRADKKFCNDQCRNSFNNKLKSNANNLMRNINNALRKNRRILSDLNPDGITKVSKDKLILMGFNFNYITNTYHTKAGKTYFFCYDYGYLPIENNYYTLVKRQEWME
jgi:hypothetical protein